MGDNYQYLQSQLQTVLDKLESTTNIDEAVKLHEQGQKLLKQLETYLAGVKKTIQAAEKKAKP